MTKNRKYSYKLEQIKDSWSAQILRQVTSKKVLVSKEQAGFSSEDDAKKWAEQRLLEFTDTLRTSNQRHGTQRKLNEEERQQRSVRRADKTEKAKELKKVKQEALNASLNEE